MPFLLCSSLLAGESRSCSIPWVESPPPPCSHMHGASIQSCDLAVVPEQQAELFIAWVFCFPSWSTFSTRVRRMEEASEKPVRRRCFLLRFLYNLSPFSCLRARSPKRYRGDVPGGAETTGVWVLLSISAGGIWPASLGEFHDVSAENTPPAVTKIITAVAASPSCTKWLLLHGLPW